MTEKSQAPKAIQLSNRLLEEASTMDMGRPPVATDTKRQAAAELIRLQAENEALRKCAVKYLTWLNVNEPEKSLESDLINPEMLA